MKPLVSYLKLLLLLLLFLPIHAGFAQGGPTSGKLIGAWYCIRIDCPDQLIQFEKRADNSLTVYRTLTLEEPNSYRLGVGGTSSAGYWELEGNSLILTEGTNGNQTRFTCEFIAGQPFLVLTTKDKCKWYLVTRGGKRKLL
ncbi:hypothetical protein [Chitinophaga varians]|uniref:hypothetical protein n=1 Tax=Chitinophaga varians TaxID=2202339 RepID=UPI00165ECED3|nr:hypothetical protein [Chitinophaga varians]MBC9909335.1 hypothetical protein [Chitinophaga varians]